MIESGLQQLISSDSRFTSLAASRLYPVLLPTDSPLPSATYQVVSTVASYALDSRNAVTQMRLQIDTWGASYADSKSLANAILSILDNYSGVLPDGTKVLGVQLHSSQDQFENQALIYRVMSEYMIQFINP